MLKKKHYLVIVSLLGLTFITLFSLIVIPPLVANPDIIGAFLAGFVNPYASGYAFDVIITWCIFAIWVLYESEHINYGWVCLLLGIVPGVAVGLASYLMLRESTLGKHRHR